MFTAKLENFSSLQISSNNYNCLLKKIATIEQKVNTRTQQQPPLQQQREPPCPLASGGTDNVISTRSAKYSVSERDSDLKTEIQLLKKELNTVHCMQERLLEQVDNLKEASSSKVSCNVTYHVNKLSMCFIPLITYR